MPSVSLALISFLPVLFLGIGLFFLAHLVLQLERNCGHLAVLGFLLITLGGSLHALWKLTLTLTGLHVAVLHHSFLIFAAPGFVLLVWACWKVFHPGSSGTPVWVVPVIIVVIGCGGAAITALSKGGQQWFYILLSMLVLARTATVLLLAWQAQQRELLLVAGLFLGDLVIASGQTNLLLRFATSPTWQWIEQGCSTVASILFAYAAWHLRHSITKR